MHFIISSIVLFTIVASLASTSLGFHQLKPRSPLHSLFPRQAAERLPACKYAEKSASACKVPRCLCTASNAALLQSCITCVIKDDSHSAKDVSDMQKIASMFNTGCANFTGVPSLSLPSSPAPSTSPAQGTTQTSLSVTASQESIIHTTPVSQASSTPTTVLTVSISLLVPPTGTANATSSAVGSSTSVAISSTSTDGSATDTLPVTASAIRNEIGLHEIGAFFGLVLGILLTVR